MSIAMRAARNAGSIARADEGADQSAIHIYEADQATLLAIRRLAKPCGTVRAGDGRIELAPHVDNDIVTASGFAAWATWVAADGAVLASGQVTDEAGFVSTGAGATSDTGDVGPFVLLGTAGTILYEGGLVLLDASVVIG